MTVSDFIKILSRMDTSLQIFVANGDMSNEYVPLSEVDVKTAKLSQVGWSNEVYEEVPDGLLAVVID